MLAERYRQQGFEISGFGASSTALKRFNKVIYVFNQGIQEDQKFVNALCECYLNIFRKKDSQPDIMQHRSPSFAAQVA